MVSVKLIRWGWGWGMTDRQTDERDNEGQAGLKDQSESNKPDIPKDEKQASRGAQSKTSQPRTDDRQPTTDTKPNQEPSKRPAKQKQKRGPKPTHATVIPKSANPRARAFFNRCHIMGGGEPWSLCVGRFGTIQTPARGPPTVQKTRHRQTNQPAQNPKVRNNIFQSLKMRGGSISRVWKVFVGSRTRPKSAQERPKSAPEGSPEVAGGCRKPPDVMRETAAGLEHLAH